MNVQSDRENTCTRMAVVAFSEAKWYLDTPSEIADLSHITCLPKRGNSTMTWSEECGTFGVSDYPGGTFRVLSTQLCVMEARSD